MLPNLFNFDGYIENWIHPLNVNNWTFHQLFKKSFITYCLRTSSFTIFFSECYSLKKKNEPTVKPQKFLTFKWASSPKWRKGRKEVQTTSSVSDLWSASFTSWTPSVSDWKAGYLEKNCIKTKSFFRYNYVGEVDEDLMCQICLQPFVQPIDTPCGHTFCHVCIHNYLKVNPMCPLDRKPLNEMTCSPSNLVLKRYNFYYLHQLGSLFRKLAWEWGYFWKMDLLDLSLTVVLLEKIEASQEEALKYATHFSSL